MSGPGRACWWWPLGGGRPAYPAGVSQIGYSRTSIGVPSFADGSKTRRVPHCAVGTLYRTVTSNVPQQPVPHVAWTGASTSTRCWLSSTWTRNGASKTCARPVTRPGDGNAPPQAGRSTKIGGRLEVLSVRPRPAPTITPSPPMLSTGCPSSRSRTASTVGNWVAVKTSWASRPNIEALPPPDSNAPVRSDERGFLTMIPAGSQLLGITIDGSVATVDLTGAFESGGGSASMFGRLAQ